LQTTAGQAQQNFGLTAAQAAQQAQAQDYSRQMQALMNTGTLTQQQNTMRSGDVAALEAAGLAQRNVAQQYLTGAQQEFQNQQLYPQQQLDWLNSQIKGIASNVPKMETINKGSTGDTYSASPLAQIASGVNLYKGLTS